MDTNQQQAILALLQLPRVGRKTARKVLAGCGSLPVTAADLSHVLTDARAELGRIPEFSQNDIAAAFREANLIMERCERMSIGVHIVHSTSSQNWIAKMNAIPDAPAILFSRGAIDALEEPCVTVIGTRKPTSWGHAAAEKVASRCVAKGFCVVSGLATGCDAAAHQGALQAKGRTVAVLAHGLDIVHPEHHKQLATEIAEESGCLVSEYAPGVAPQRGSFVERDRLQSAIGSAVIVIETGVQGGTNHTVSFAKEQNRSIGCLVHPENLANHRSVQGNKKILDEGAFPIGSKQDLIEFLESHTKIESCEEIVSSDQRAPKQDSLF